MEAETTDQATSNQLRLGHTDEETLPEFIPTLNPNGSSKDDDFLCGLNPEEKECLEYFLQTISTLDEYVSEDDDERYHEEGVDSVALDHVVCASTDAEDQGKSRVNPSKQQRTSLEAALAIPVPAPAVPKVKIMKSLSEEAGDSSLRSRNDSDYLKSSSPCRSGDSHPIHLRRFDTIMRSGVNVQELRSRFLLHHDSSANLDREPREDSVGRINQPDSLSGIQKTSKDGALQKLGFLQRNSSSPNMKIPLRPMIGQQAQISRGKSLDLEGIAGSINAPEEPL